MGLVQPRELPGHLLSSADADTVDGAHSLSAGTAGREHPRFALVSHYHLQASREMALAHHRRGN